MKNVGKVLAIGFAVYLFFLMISNIDFKGMSFSEIKLVVSICVGIAMSFVSAKAGANFIHSTLVGFVVSAFFFALMQTVIQMIFK